MKFAHIAIALFAILSIGHAAADTIRESYVATLSEQDHFNSKGERLTSAAAIIRQDRANFHVLGKRDPGDQNDRFFANAKNREALEQLLSRGKSDPAVLRSIVNGTPNIMVTIHQSESGNDYVTVAVSADHQNAEANPTLLESYVAVLSERDHFNSSGTRLTTAAAIIRQDRANFHKFGKRDHGDQSDRFFAGAKNRALLEQYIARGTSSPATLRAILNGTPTITVNIYRSADGQEYVNVIVNG